MRPRAAAILNVGDLVLDQVSFTENSADGGGAMLAYSTATATGSACSFSLNSPDDIATHVGSYTFDETVDFVCGSEGCVVDEQR